MGRIIFKLETRVGDTIFLVAKNEEEARKTASEYSSRFRANYRDIKCVKIGNTLDYLALSQNYAFESPYCKIITFGTRNDTEIKEEQKMTRLDKTLAITKQCQDKFIEFNISWVMNNISKTIDMHLIPRIEDAKDQVDTRYCQGMLDAISDLLTDKLREEIQSKIYSKQIQLGILPF
jgi:diadenosine tetraphosphate (Ap4A) HIT family hydrolase